MTLQSGVDDVKYCGGPRQMLAAGRGFYLSTLLLALSIFRGMHWVYWVVPVKENGLG
jgi:hypothetical protein